MKKISIIILASLLSAPVWAAENADDHALVAASYQQGEDADPAAPVTKPAPPVAAPKVAGAEPTAVPATVSADKPAVKPEESITFSALHDLQSQVQSLREQHVRLHKQMIATQYAVYTLGGLLILLAFCSLTRRHKKSKVVSPVASAPDSGKTIPIEDDTRSEYDFMGSSEGIAAKLDLARAYIAMEDFAAARETLADILRMGNEAHRLEAKALLSKLN